MLQEKKYIIIVVGVLIVVGTVIAIYFIHKGKPRNVIENNLEIKLPSSAKITDYTYNKKWGNFYAKILCESHSINGLKDQLERQLGRGISEQKYPETIDYKNLKNNFCEWWDMDTKNIVESYNTFASGKKRIFGTTPKTREIWAIITRNQKGENHLYIMYL